MKTIGARSKRKREREKERERERKRANERDRNIERTKEMLREIQEKEIE